MSSLVIAHLYKTLEIYCDDLLRDETSTNIRFIASFPLCLTI